MLERILEESGCSEAITWLAEPAAGKNGLRHIRFVRDHQKKVRRIAVSADGSLAELELHLVDNFVAVEVRHFGYEELEGALDWAAQRD
jgi:hypothetical protein